MATILFVDDEVQILRAIRRLFMQTDYDVLFAENAQEALEILKEENIDVVVTDMRMPVMDGYQLLENVKEKYPKTIRLILSGHSDENKIIKAIQNNYAKMYLFKPWSNEELLNIIKNLLKTSEDIKEIGLSDIISNIDKLPSMPNIYNELCFQIEEKESIENISENIKRDQAISLELLKVANSVFYQAKTGSIKKAISYLGLQSVKDIILSISLFNELKHRSYIFNKEILFDHAYIAEEYLKIIYKELLKKELPNDYKSSGLLHDIGRLVILNNYRDRYLKIEKEFMNQDTRLLYEYEKEYLDINHQEVGGYLLYWWGLPQTIFEAAMYHHEPNNENIIYKELVSVVHLADYISWNILNEDYKVKLDLNILHILGIQKEQLDDFLEKILSR